MAHQKKIRKLTPKEAEQLMQQEPNHRLVDVRSPEEYAEGHAREAISIPVDAMGWEASRALPDKNQLILLCCHSGLRSQLAAELLGDRGYTNLCVLGGVDELIADERERET